MSADPLYAGSYKGLSVVLMLERFGSEDHCYEVLEALRWPDGVQCPRCESKAISRIRKRRQFDCDRCRYQFSVRVGSAFQNSKIPLWKWFLAIHVICESSKRISSNQITQLLGVSYRTALPLCHRIRSVIPEASASCVNANVLIGEIRVSGRFRDTLVKLIRSEPVGCEELTI